jgi:tRNA(fMet)-specific endonuclease VapC
MNGNILDTNVIIRLLNGDENVRSAIYKMTDICIPVVVVGELLFGAEKSQKREQNRRNYLAPLHGVRSLTPEAETVTGFEARFAVNERLRKRLGAMTAAVTAVVDPAPQISLIENPVAKDNEPKDVLKATFSARITGRKLKVGGEKGGIFFVPAIDNPDPDSGGKIPSGTEADWVRVPDDFITHNADTRLEFHLPRTLEPGRDYFIAVRTEERGGVKLRNPVTGISRIPVTVAE